MGNMLGPHAFAIERDAGHLVGPLELKTRTLAGDVSHVHQAGHPFQLIVRVFNVREDPVHRCVDVDALFNLLHAARLSLTLPGEPRQRVSFRLRAQKVNTQSFRFRTGYRW